MFDKAAVTKRIRLTFKTKIQIKKRVKSVVDGRQQLVLKPFFNCYCNIKELWGKELYEAINIKMNNALNFDVMYCKKLEQMRQDTRDYVVIFEGQEYDVYYIDFKNNSKDIVTIKCNQVT